MLFAEGFSAVPGVTRLFPRYCLLRVNSRAGNAVDHLEQW